MKKCLIILGLALLFTAICYRHGKYTPSGEKEDSCCDTPLSSEDSTLSMEGLSTIEQAIMVFGSDCLTVKERAHWDSMNKSGGYLLIRGAERNLDTIINYIHIIFITER